MQEYRGLFEKIEELGEGLKRAEMRGIVRTLEGRSKIQFAAQNMGKTKVTGYIPARMVNFEKCLVYEEDSDDITFLTDKLIREGLSKEERKELDFIRALNGLGDE